MGASGCLPGYASPLVARPRREQLRIALCALYRICGLSTRCHVPPEAVARLPREARGIAAKALKRLVALGLAWEKTHGPGRRSYGLTKKGVELARELCGEG
ncbi:hypothetical protein [Pyrodictium abyssi]|uniref:Transcriptional regulator n=1 Tax=Pyrodictium abyssi TaxID=54256 RepID=A0ABM8J006_9CREN|nr:hypothetical protein PABY_14870 [Pyrodictium abyssi]